MVIKKSSFFTKRVVSYFLIPSNPFVLFIEKYFYKPTDNGENKFKRKEKWDEV